jgi:glycosyltransferase involved in cell wall biosynthesis
MLLVLPVPFRRRGDALLFEAQACNGIEKWADNFRTLVAACPVLPERLVTSDGSQVWKDVREIRCADRVEFVPLPWAFSVGDFMRAYGPARRLLSGHIRRCRYLQFALWGFVGDWASVAALEAIKLGRPYSLHIDSVNHVISRRSAIGHGIARRIKAELEAPMMKRLHAYLAGKCALGLWHGNDTYQVYSRWCENSHNIHDIHTKPEDCISAEDCESKAQEAERAPVLRVCYAGRALAIKGPLDWVRAIGHARGLGAEVESVWIGDGPMLDEARALAKELGLADRLSMPGFVSDRAKVLETLRHGHIMPFAHLTPESPRCLLESLLSGTPIVGYDNAFARDLLEGHGGGSLVPLGDWQKLGEELARLAKDRTALSDLIREAGANGARFNDDAVFKERSALIKKYLL